MRCPVHLSVGQEATAVGACAALRPEDRIVSTHRCHGHYLAKGGDLTAMLAEMHGKATGCCGGRGGSMHLHDERRGWWPASRWWAAPSLGVGIALRFPAPPGPGVHGVPGRRRPGRRGLSRGGQLRRVHRLPVVFFVENNLYSVYTRLASVSPTARSTSWPRLTACPAGRRRQRRAGGAAAARGGGARARAGNGPGYGGRRHLPLARACGPAYDDELGYRPQGELASWQDRCPVERFRQALRQADMLERGRRAELQREIDAEIARPSRRCRRRLSPTPATVAQGVWRDRSPGQLALPFGGRGGGPPRRFRRLGRSPLPRPSARPPPRPWRPIRRCS